MIENEKTIGLLRYFHFSSGLIKLSINENESRIYLFGGLLGSPVAAVVNVFLEWRLDNEILSSLGLDLMRFKSTTQCSDSINLEHTRGGGWRKSGSIWHWQSV